MSDLVTQSLDRILHGGEYERFDGIPVFDEHEVKDKNGNVIRKVGRKELEELCEKNNRRLTETGDLSPIGPGHTRGPLVPETEQPDIWGYAAQWHVGEFGPAGKLAAKVNLYVKRQVQDGEKTITAKEALARYPRRSVEYWPSDGIIDWIGLLKQTPKRDLGVVTFARDQKRGEKLCYSMESDNMPDPAAVPDAMAPDQEFQDKVIRCIKEAYPSLDRMHGEACQRYAAEQQPEPNAAPGAPAMASPTNAAPPVPVAPEKKPDEAERMQRDSERIDYARKVKSLEDEVALLRESNRQAVERHNKSDAHRVFTQAKAEYFVVDTEEVPALEKTDDAGRERWLADVRKYRRKDEAASEAPVDLPHLRIADQEPVKNGKDLSEREWKEVVQYMRDTGEKDFHAARAKMRKAN